MCRFLNAHKFQISCQAYSIMGSKGKANTYVKAMMICFKSFSMFFIFASAWAMKTNENHDATFCCNPSQNTHPLWVRKDVLKCLSKTSMRTISYTLNFPCEPIKSLTICISVSSWKQYIKHNHYNISKLPWLEHWWCDCMFYRWTNLDLRWITCYNTQGS